MQLIFFKYKNYKIEQIIFLHTNRDLRHSSAMSAIPAPACWLAVAFDFEESARTTVTSCLETPGVLVAFPLAVG